MTAQRDDTTRPSPGRIHDALLRAATVCVYLLVIGATLWLAARILASLMPVTVAIVAAVLLTALVQPLTELLVRWHAPRWLATLTTVLLTLGAVVFVVVLLVSRARSQLTDLRAAVANGVDDLRQALLDSPLPLSEGRVTQAQEQLLDTVLTALPSPATGAGLATEVLSSAALTVFLWFFLLKDGRSMWRWALRWCPARTRPVVDDSGAKVWGVVTRYVRGTTAVAAVDAIGVGIGLVVLGVPLWASLTLIVFLGAYVPIVGAFVSGGLAVLVTLVTEGPVKALVMLGVVLLVQQLEGNLLQPLIMGRALHLHPVAIVLAITVGALVAGVLGAVVAVPVLAVVNTLAEQARRRADRTAPPSNTEDVAAEVT